MVVREKPMKKLICRKQVKVTDSGISEIEDATHKIRAGWMLYDCVNICQIGKRTSIMLT